ncbi:hypothetical protein EYZ11_008785 [Aspergillus tanneri]|uniref:Uncharacterized protein n=1 Tax=Aspergillus tanneri TaxID=1220188 RepID=A0A4V3UNM4_9EURO|nr:hypothetical protein EYZ11_008785 [Aspergillus tanneri]
MTQSFMDLPADVLAKLISQLAASLRPDVLAASEMRHVQAILSFSDEEANNDSP